MTRHSGNFGIQERDANDLPGERRFILHLARHYALSDSDTSYREKIGDWRPLVTSWNVLRSLLAAHAMSVIGYSELANQAVRESINPPDEIVKDLRDCYTRAFIKSTIEKPLVKQLFDALDNEGAQTLVIKGFALGPLLYRDAVHREHSDIDLLAQESDAQLLDSLLITMGYRRLPLKFETPPPMPGEALHSETYVHSSGNLTVDICFDPMRSFWSTGNDSVGFPEWWNHKQAVSRDQLTFHTLGSEHQFIHLARHLQHHDFFRVNWFVDLMLLLQKSPNLDWDYVGRSARPLGVHGGVYRTLELLNDVYDFAPPKEAMAALQPNAMVRRLHQRIWPTSLAAANSTPVSISRPLSPKLLSPFGPHSLAGLALIIANTNRVRNIGYLARRVVPTGDWLRRAYGQHDSDQGSRWHHLTAYWRWLIKHRREVRNSIRKK